jgi:hypothetical protein
MLSLRALRFFERSRFHVHVHVQVQVHGHGLQPWSAALCVAALLGAAPAIATEPPVLTLAKPEDQARFRVTTFVSGLSFPTSLTALDDGSLLVGTSNGSSLFSATSSSLLRLVDLDSDGFADGPPTALATGLPGLVTSVRRLDDLVVALSSQAGNETISLWRTGPTAADPLTAAGDLKLRFPKNFEHTTYALAVQKSPTDPSALEMFFNVGAKTNDSKTPDNVTVGLEGDGDKIKLGLTQLVADSIQRVTLKAAEMGASFTTSVTQIASGLRNAAGMVFAPNGDLYFQDNGIDTPENRNISLSADELNRIPAEDLGSSLPGFGFPHTYISYATGETIFEGGAVCPDICNHPAGVTPPLLVFRPVNGRKSEGAVELAMAPQGFGEDFAGGIFTSFFGKFAGGPANDENPVVFANPHTGEYYHFINNGLLGHPNGLLATQNSLFLTDLDFGGNLTGSTKGVIYQITPNTVPAEVPGPLASLGIGSGMVWSRRLRARLRETPHTTKPPRR